MKSEDWRTDTKLYRKRDFLFALFVSSMVMVNTLGTKIISIVGIRVSVGIFFVPVLFLVTDIIGEVFGRAEASRFVNMATIMLVVLFVMMGICIAVPPNESWGCRRTRRSSFPSGARSARAT